jgi:hypothetical protein
LGIGTITIHKKDSANFNVYSIKELQLIIYSRSACIKYPLITPKDYDFYYLNKRGRGARDHLTEKGVLEKVGFKSALNLGFSDKLRKAFLNFVPVPRPAFKFNGICK